MTQISTIARLALLGAAAAALGGCVYDGDYGASAGYASGYGGGGGYYDDGYGGYGGGYYDDPAYYGGGYGWYNGFWYPGTGLFVYDRFGHGRRWSDGERDHWSHRGPNGGWNGGRPGGWQDGHHGHDGGWQGHGNPPPPYTNGGHWPPRGNGSGNGGHGGQWAPPPHRDGFVNGVGRAVNGRHGRH